MSEAEDELIKEEFSKEEFSKEELSKEELSKEEKLEAARKKFEKLKKKNKKKKDKKKEKKDGEEGDVKEEDVVETDRDEVAELKDEEVTKSKVEEVKEVKEEVEEEVEEPKKEVKEVREEATELAKETDKLDELFKSEETEDADIFNNLDPNSEPPKPTEKSISPPQTAESSSSLSLSNITDKDELINKLRTQLESLKKENSHLKFEKLDLLDEIETLKETVQELKIKSIKKNIDYAENQDDSSEVSLSPSRPTNNSRRRSVFGNYVPQYQQPISQPQVSGPYQPQYGQYQQVPQPQVAFSYDELKAQILEKSKNFSLDMRSWRSVGSGPIVEI